MTDAFGEYKGCFVRFYGPGGEAVGAGCLVGEHQIVTCAHVVMAALDWAAGNLEAPTGEIRVDFPLLEDRPALTASVVRWVPVSQTERGDIALLTFEEDLPPSARPAFLLQSTDVWGHGFRAYGFPAQVPGGQYASGRLLAAQATGWVQLEDIRAQGGRIQRGYSGAPVWDEVVQGVVGIVVAAAVQADLKVGYLIPTGQILEAAGDILPAQVVPPCPYRGLSSFREQDSGVFFGQKHAVAQLVAATANRAFLAVLGPSGSGKSSVVYAGLVPALRGVGRWRVADFRPGSDPFDSLAAAVVPFLRPDIAGPAAALERLKMTPEVREVIEARGVALVLREVVSSLKGEQLLFVIDQFEELFTACRDADLRLRFIESLAGAVRAAQQESQRSVLFVITMRADFLGQVLAYRQLADIFQRADVKLGPMTPAELMAAVEQPAFVSGVRFEDGLAARVVADVNAQAGRLPLLEFALTLLWEMQRNRTMTHQGYEAIGGVEQALAQYADSVYLALPESDQERARRIFVQLVKPGEGTEDTRRVASAGDVSSGDWEVLRWMATKRLVVTDRDPAGGETAEVAHEALIRAWVRLRDWLTADRDFRTWQERLRDAVRLWTSRDEDDGVLLRGLLLIEAEEWLTRRLEEIGPLERDFVARSRQRQNEQEAQYRALYEAALARQLAAQAELLRGDGVVASQLAVLLAVEALRRHQSFETDLALRRALENLGRLSAKKPVFASGEDPRRGAAIAARVVRVDDDAVRVSDPSQAVEVTVVPYIGWVHAVALSRDETLLAVGGDDGTATVWQVGGDLVASFTHGAFVNAVAFSPDGASLATAGDDGAARVWDIGGGEVGRFPHEGLVTAVAFSSAGGELAVAGQDGQIRVWHVRREVELQRLPDAGEVVTIAFSPDDGYLVCDELAETRWLPLRAEDLIGTACALVARNMTPAEWAQYLRDEPYRPTCPGAAMIRAGK